MTTANVNFREGSVVSKLYNVLKDGKAQKYSTLRAKFVKAGVTKPYSHLLRLDRILRTQTGTTQVNLSKRIDYVQIVPIAKALQLRAAWEKANPGLTAVTPRSAATKTAPKPKSKTAKKPAKAKAVKQVAVPIGADEYDDEGLE